MDYLSYRVVDIDFISKTCLHLKLDKPIICSNEKYFIPVKGVVLKEDDSQISIDLDSSLILYSEEYAWFNRVSGDLLKLKVGDSIYTSKVECNGFIDCYNSNNLGEVTFVSSSNNISIKDFCKNFSGYDQKVFEILSLFKHSRSTLRSTRIQLIPCKNGFTIEISSSDLIGVCVIEYHEGKLSSSSINL